ncbi:hypothetical protein CRM22_000163 [Opisthorchis felineus]|uniref:Phosphoglycolate phosphatase n=1 Tax=Opisthorchis felineus TaxID=147828 RepID=A0A4S2MG97_OPIFE|nr:hypothetical protein CRM22_000163 [Opisthorchis felineus]
MLLMLLDLSLPCHIGGALSTCSPQLPMKTKRVSSAAEVLRQCSTYLFDCDGVLWNSKNVIPGAIALLDRLFQLKRNVFLITNNSTKSVEQYCEKCRTLGLPVSAKNIICSANVAANYLKCQGNFGPIYVVGQSGIGLELDKCGIAHFGIGPDQGPDNDVFRDVHLKPNTTGVLIGFDEYFNYRKLIKATSYVCRGLPFFATNEDAQLPEGDTILPGTGSILASVKYAAGKEPIVMGKPHQPIFDVLRNQYNIDPGQTLMIGDRLDTDIAFGNRFGMYTACVLTGVTDSELLSKVKNDPERKLHRPTCTFESVQQILEKLNEVENQGAPHPTG